MASVKMLLNRKTEQVLALFFVLFLCLCLHQRLYPAKHGNKKVNTSLSSTVRVSLI